MNHNMTRVTALAFLLLALIAPATRAAPFTNGSFESGTSNDSGGFTNLGTGSTSITGWTVSVGNIDWIGSYWNASDGVRSIDLAGTNSSGTISQIFDTTPGQSYLVTFDLSGNPEGPPISKTLEALIDGNLAGSFGFDTTGQAIPNINWSSQSFTFTATGASTTIAFRDASGGTSFGAALDNVAVTAVPEPMTLTLFGLCAAGAGVYGWRRRQQPAA